MDIQSDQTNISSASKSSNNRSSNKTPAAKNAVKTLGENDFYKLLVTQLKYQDPMKPMSDMDFIAQMAQFHSLDQLKGINKAVSTLQESSRQKNMMEFLGKKVRVRDPRTYKNETGRVTEVRLIGNEQRIVVNDRSYRYKDIVSILQEVKSSND